MNSVVKFYFFLALTFAAAVSAQFTITNSLKTANASGLKIGDDAKLTAATGVDAVGAGWLRLTEAATNRKGYMYVQQNFPTTLGVIADFEYVTWRNTADNTYNGADGFSVFLFDGSVPEANFKLGGYGGSLGYATYNNPAGTTGLSGGYIGLGFDEFGNYAAGTEGRNGGAGVIANAVVLRGPTLSTYTQSNMYLAHTALGDQSGGIAEVRKRNIIDYNTVTATRPAETLFYRRVQVYVTREATNYRVRVKWRKENQTIFEEIMNYVIDASIYPLPATLRLGFAASTGGGFNFHEIRNILLTTPGNLRVDSRSNYALICNEKQTDDVTFKIEVSNDTDTALNNLAFNTQLQDAGNNILSPAQFKISSITTTGFTGSTLPTSGFASNNITGTLGLGARKSGIVTVTGRYYKRALSNNQNFKSVSSVYSTEITDIDETNNITTTLVNVKRCNIITNPSMPSYSR